MKLRHACILAAILGLAALLHTSAVAFQTFKYAGVAYLLYMAWMTLKERGALNVEPDRSGRSALQVTIHAILINILNPKLSIFFFACESSSTASATEEGESSVIMSTFSVSYQRRAIATARSGLF